MEMSICLLLKLIGCFGSKLLIRKSEASKKQPFSVTLPAPDYVDDALKKFFLDFCLQIVKVGMKLMLGKN